MPFVDAESEAAFLLRPFDRPPSATALVRHHLGADSIFIVPGLRTPAALGTLHGRPIVSLRARLPALERRWLLCHELAEWHLQRLDYRGEDIELVAEAIAAALVCPRDAFRQAVRRRGPAFEQLAFDFDATPTCTALRLGEVEGTPIVVASPAAVRVRGEPFGWPEDEGALRRMTQLPTPPGLRKAALDRRRVAIWADESAA